tara:strand:- start:2247 stop:2456 length:210 start_codon:yes stop_codon:yes gene_type:complete
LDITSFKGTDREQITFMPERLNDWLLEDHLAKIVIDILSKMDLQHIYLSYSFRGSSPYDRLNALKNNLI